MAIAARTAVAIADDATLYLQGWRSEKVLKEMRGELIKPR